MLVEAAEFGRSGSVFTDVCVVGAGPAGITVAHELDVAGIDSVLLEAGGRPYDRERLSSLPKTALDHMWGAQSLGRGLTKGEPYFPLRMSRARGIGGSTNVLRSHGLRSRPLDVIDFGPRFGLKWPIRFDEFESFLPAAALYCGLTDNERSGAQISWAPQSVDLGTGVTQHLVAAPFRHGPRDAFTSPLQRFSGAGGPTYVTSAVAAGFRTNGEDAVTSVEVRTLQGGSFMVRASLFVLATGGIDNARLLLSSDSILSLMGSSADHVGRHFMEHLHYVAAHLLPASPEVAAEVHAIAGDPEQPRHWLTLNDRLVHDEKLLRVAFAAVPVHEASLKPAVQAVGSLVRLVPYGPFAARPRMKQAGTALGGVPHVIQAAASRLRRRSQRQIFALPLMSEQPPDSASRISLSRKRDRIGLPLPILDWRVSQRELNDAKRSTEVLAAEAARLGLGEVVSLWDRGANRPPVVRGGWHHMGTTRMSRDPAAGVVDQDCRVHGLANLFVAGSSVFPTSGYANPTLSLVALASRLGQHLVEKLR